MSTRRIRGRSADVRAHSAPCTPGSLSTSSAATHVHSGPFSASASSCFIFILDSFSPEVHSSSACYAKQSSPHNRLPGRLRAITPRDGDVGLSLGPAGKGLSDRLGSPLFIEGERAAGTQEKSVIAPSFLLLMSPLPEHPHILLPANVLDNGEISSRPPGLRTRRPGPPHWPTQEKSFHLTSPIPGSCHCRNSEMLAAGLLGRQCLPLLGAAENTPHSGGA